MSLTATIAAATITAEDKFHAPSAGLFDLPSIADSGITKSMVLVSFSAVLILGFTILSSRKAAVVPGRLQFAGEMVYGFVRNTIAREAIGSEKFMKFVPFLFSLFLFIIVNNYYGIIPLVQLPSFGRIGYIVPLAALAWLVFIGAGIKKHGFFGFFKHATVPHGVPAWILVLLVPLEFLSNIIVRPFTLTLRLFGNMFAGHLLLALFATGGAFLLQSGNPVHAGVGVLAFAMGILVSFLELIVMFLQAYVFTLLAAMYIGEAIADEH